MRFTLLMLLVFSVLTVKTHQSQLRKVDCSFIKELKGGSDIECGALIVPENRHNPKAKQITISYAILKSQESSSNQPLIYLNGGPGGTSLELINFWAGSALRNHRDLILVDQRGTGYSSALPDFGPKLYEVISGDYTADQETEVLISEGKRHVADMRSKGFNPESYNIFENASDLIDLMRSLGYEGYHLLGISYGTKLGQIIATKAPELISSAVMYGPVSVDTEFFSNMLGNYEKAFRAFSRDCTMNSHCSDLLPDPVMNFKEAIEALEKEPISLRLNESPFVLNAQDAVYFLRYLLYGNNPFETIPQYIQAILTRDVSKLEELSLFPARMITIGNTSAYISSIGYDDIHSSSAKNYHRALKNGELFDSGIAFFTSVVQMTDGWLKQTANSSEKMLKPTDVPTMIMVHEHDPASPPANLSKYEAYFKNTQTRLFKEYGHISLTKEKLDLMNEFFLLHD